MAAVYYFPSFHCLSFHRLYSLSPPSLNPYRHRHYRCTTICAAGIKKPRVSRKVKSNADLCNDIREFLTAVGLPEGHVPTTKELSQHGRQDLANLVRRRGHKLIRELLATSTETELLAEQDRVIPSKEKPTGQDEALRDPVEDVLLSSELPLVQDNLSSTTLGRDLSSDEGSCTSIESPSNSSLQEKVAMFIQSGVLDENEEPESSSLAEAHNNLVLTRTDTANISDMKGTSSFQQDVSPRSENGPPRNNLSSTEAVLNSNIQEDMDAQDKENENQAEINRLQFMLHQKDSELSELKQQFVKEKLALATMQTKAETEISKARKLISEKDAELLSAEESLSGLKEVEILYWSEGETVEMAGSFNGWHHRIEMDPQPSSSIIDSRESRKSRLWRTALWLYPGMYEIKFIVDGHWKTDPQRETVTRGAIYNNVLRVDR